MSERNYTSAVELRHSRGCRCRGRQALSGSSSADPGPFAKDFGGVAASLHYPPSLEIEPTATTIHLRLDLQAETADLRVLHKVTGRRDGVRQLRLDGVDFFDLTARDSSGQDVTVHYDGAAIQITWAKPFAAGEERTVELTYRVEKPQAGLYFMQPTAAEPDKPYYAATDHETELARYWLACVDLPNVRTSLDIHLTAKAELTLLANGALLTEVLHDDGTKTAHWQLKERCPSYLICFAVGDFSRFDDGKVGGVPLAYFATKDFSPGTLELSFGRTRAMLAWITERLGVAYPFPKYYQFALPNFGGAMENISLVSWSDSLLVDARKAAEGTWVLDQTNIHEMAHSFFGDLVVCRDFAHAWLKESWATYMETCWLEAQKGTSAPFDPQFSEQLYDLYCNAHSYFDEADSRYARPLVTRKFTSSWQMYDRHLYPGGACRLHTLRWELGDKIFWAAVTDYLQTFAGGVVETSDFQRMLEKHSGRSLQKLFDQWVYTAAYPDLKVSFNFDAEKHLGTFEVVQKQADEAKGIPAFEFGTELGWTIDGTQQLLPVRITAARQSFQVAMAKEPEQVRFDPRWQVLHKLEFEPGDTMLKIQLTKATDVVGRIQAAVQLCNSGKRSALKAVLAAYQTEPFYGVRQEMVKALAASQTEEAIVGLVAIIASEAHAMVLPTLFAAVTGLRDERLAQAVTTRLAAGGLGPNATARAFGALGEERSTAPVDLLRQAAEQPVGAYGVEQAAALAALGRSHQVEQLPYLLGKSRPGKTPYRARTGAVRGLGLIGASLEKSQQRDLSAHLTSLLRDADPYINAEAATALQAMRAKDAVPALEAYRARLPLQQQVVVDQLLAGLRRDDDPGLAAVEKQLDELRTKLRKMHEQMQDLEAKLTGKLAEPVAQEPATAAVTTT